MDMDKRKNLMCHTAVYEFVQDMKRVRNPIVLENSSMGKSIDAQNSEGLTRLMIASICGDLPTVKRMVKQNATLDIVNRDGNSAIMLAAWNACYDIVRFLDESGAETNILNEKGQNMTDLILESSFEMDGVIERCKYEKETPIGRFQQFRALHRELR